MAGEEEEEARVVVVTGAAGFSSLEEEQEELVHSCLEWEKGLATVLFSACERSDLGFPE